MATVRELLELVGELDDSEREGTPRERFRNFLRQSVSTPADLRDYVEGRTRRCCCQPATVAPSTCGPTGETDTTSWGRG